MAFSKGFKYKLLIFTVKKPHAVFIGFALILILVLYITNTSYTGIYIKATGTLNYDSNDQRCIHITTDISNKYKDAIDSKNYTVWYVRSDGKRYYGSITNIQNLKSSNRLQVEVIARREDCYEELGANYIEYKGPINLEIYFKRKNIINKILDKLF
ncbi:hypothetical protein [Pelosinus fermentans]|uniref:Uncharacterized protein n=1 Tax=Pelosinus fermentans JBW45 TaxID=1192197 RepID=I8TYX9_9FIRM|nr:hypothetical protein [Pelosinus fermentans]AJQ26604.1 hypothetical protein JBW_01252 [Pelosinus fermentans JBW45]